RWGARWSAVGLCLRHRYRAGCLGRVPGLSRPTLGPASAAGGVPVAGRRGLPQAAPGPAARGGPLEAGFAHKARRAVVLDEQPAAAGAGAVAGLPPAPDTPRA